MAMQKHGNKKYFQLLIDPHRAELLKELADEKGVKITAIMRELVYKGLERALPSTTYNEAEALDQAQWRASIRNRVQGRQAKRKERDQLTPATDSNAFKLRLSE